MNALSFVLVRSGDYLHLMSVHVSGIDEGSNLDDLVTWELETRNMHSIESHEIAIENSENRFMSNDQEIVLFALQLEDDGFKSNSEVVI